jgi:hypothetical protein
LGGQLHRVALLMQFGTVTLHTIVRDLIALRLEPLRELPIAAKGALYDAALQFRAHRFR